MFWNWVNFFPHITSNSIIEKCLSFLKLKLEFQFLSVLNTKIRQGKKCQRNILEINNSKIINYNRKVLEKRILQIPSQQFECNGLWILNCFSLFPIEIAWPDLTGPVKISILVTHHWLISYLKWCLAEYSNMFFWGKKFKIRLLSS